MVSAIEFWERKNQAAGHDGGPRPHGLARELDHQLNGASSVLELGGGQGHDALYLAGRGHRVSTCDFSASALRRFAAPAVALGVVQHLLDVTALPYPFEAEAFDAVYARLSLHYFAERTTRAIFGEIARVLRPGGVFLGLFNSSFDVENGTGRRIEDRYFEIMPGCRKRFFTADEARALLGPDFRSVESEYVDAARPRLENKFVKIRAVRSPEPLERRKAQAGVRHAGSH